MASPESVTDPRGTAHPVPTLTPAPRSLAATRAGMHQVAFHVLAPWRYRAEGRLGLRWTPGGLGTPPVVDGDGEQQLRLVDATLVIDRDGASSTVTATSLAAAAAAVGLPLVEQWFADFRDPLPMWRPDRQLDLDAPAVGWLGEVFAFGTHVLEQLRATDGAVDPSIVQLWPEHLDVACELGAADEGTRASFGVSPGDAGQELPYLYIAPWDATHAQDDWFADPHFPGASLPLEALLHADDQVVAAVTFLREGAVRAGALR